MVESARIQIVIMMGLQDVQSKRHIPRRPVIFKNQFPAIYIQYVSQSTKTMMPSITKKVLFAAPRASWGKGLLFHFIGSRKKH